MKKIISILLCAVLLFAAAAIPAAADDGDAAPLQLPQIRIVTEDGNGTTLQKADGYVNATVSITDTDGSVLEGAVQFKVRGNTTAMVTVQKKAFTFKFSKKQEVLGMGKGKKWAMLANAFDPTLLRNYIAFSIAQHLDLEYTSKQQFVELWVDGSFRGLYTLMEPVQEGKDRVNIDIESNNGMKDFLIEFERLLDEEDVSYFTTNGLRFAVKEPEEPNEEQLAYISGIVDDTVNTIRNGSREAIEAKIDVTSFAKYFLLNEFYKTYDFDTSSVFYYYQNGLLHAGPAWDYDLSTGNALNTFARGKNTYEPEGVSADKQIFSFLYKHDWFKEEVRKVYRDNYAYLTGIPAQDGLMDTLLTTYGDAIARNYSDAGWKPSRAWINIQMKPLATYDANVDYLRNWMTKRTQWMRDYYGVYLIGDADNDYTVTVLDATRIQRILVNMDPDTDGKGAIRGRTSEDALSILDATAIQRKLVNFSVDAPIGEAALYPES